MKNILVIHGPNLNLLGTREIDVYGNVTIADINILMEKKAKAMNVSLNIVQSNHEGEIVEAIGNARGKFDAILINPAAYTHTSIAIRDAISAVNIPTVEVHLSNIYKREEFRHISLVAPVAVGQISGFGEQSYVLGLEAIMELLDK
ncbi:MAG: type II 3-dehydroquinate dehydratase [Candidatus Omnitrophica bacterium]|nr:type II 3-dehydroquinate dehydratase [Candidatus Omnitrophota bacterium]MBU0881752.1 type II 3-dehydroquinate dehydratase [Candidatus Omnitrophota bacterium]MBU1038428.1 type II 3-dehydroquinate dehydratase [Candidatus Omnitrophota bacterium]MBU1809456.1 type II 3-dehydroquinate dehydratase [Candidatus Omnitrophota bacterium]